jgi:mannose-6-phosphate isomerase-like protein (cupin superfamily)
MRKLIKLTSLIILAILCICISNPGFSQDNKLSDKSAVSKIITFNPDSTSYQEIFDGEKDSVVFYSGVVTVLPKTSGHLHSTEIYEEMIVVLEGEGQVRVTKQKNLDLKFGNIVFIPPNTEHQVFNTGTKNFKYIYIATKSKQ